MLREVTPNLKLLLASFQRGDITERALSYLLAMHVWDYLELPAKDADYFSDIATALADSRGG